MNPQPHPKLTAQRRQKLEAISHAIRAIRLSPGGWSDGQTLYKGEALAEVRKGFTDRLINLREQIAGGGPTSAERDNARAWSNTTAMLRMKARVAPGEVPLAQRMADCLTPRDADMGSKERNRVARRVLRRQFPEVYRELPVSLSMSKTEKDYFIETSATRGMVMARDVTVGLGLVLKASTPVTLIGDGSFSTRFVVPSTERSPVGMSTEVELRPADIRRPRSRRTEALSSAPEPF